MYNKYTTNYVQYMYIVYSVLTFPFQDRLEKFTLKIKKKIK